MLSIAKRALSSTRSAQRQMHFRRMERAGVSPFVCISAEPISKSEARVWLSDNHLEVPNLSGFYHGVLRRWWEAYALGERCLLISETKAVAQVFEGIYPNTKFITTDYFVELQPNPSCDVVWDICSQTIPDELVGMNSIVCQATFEHIQDPVQAMRNLSACLETDGILYVQTHTPAYQYHGWPRDYLRYFPDWFVDICHVVKELELVELLCVDGHAFAAYRKQ